MHKYDDFKKVMAELEETGFMVKEHELNGKTVYLINPQHIGCTWTPDTLIYRSSVWDEDGKPVSLSWKKFFNFGEASHIVEDPTDLTGSVIMDKRDGSTLIVSVFNGDWVIRTRGTVDATNLNNGYEIESLKLKYPKFFNDHVKEDITDCNISVIFEWETPNNRIVLNNCNDPQIILTGIIDNSCYKYYPNSRCADLAYMWGVDRPEQYTFDTLDELITWIKDSHGIEGCCLYFDGGQQIKKIKSVEYLKLHAFKFNMAGSYKPLCEYVIQNNFTAVSVAKQHIVDTYDFECWEFIEDKITNVIVEFNTLKKEIDKAYISFANIQNQKAFAVSVISGDSKHLSAYMFAIRKSEGIDLWTILSSDKVKRKLTLDLIARMEKYD